MYKLLQGRPIMAGRSRNTNPSTKGLVKNVTKKTQAAKPTGTFSIYGYDFGFLVETTSLFP